MTLVLSGRDHTFRTVPLGWPQWLACVGMASTLWVSELRKLILRHPDRSVA